MNRRVLLLEPNYKNKYPPIGLMKLATYFRLRGDDVVFYKGDLKEFVVRGIVEECVKKLKSIDSTIVWESRVESIAKYIRGRKGEDLERVGIGDSVYAILLLPWLEYYKDYFHKGKWKSEPKWDWVGVTTLFTFYWDITVETIEFAKLMVKDRRCLMVGGILASIQPQELESATGVRPHVGVLGTSLRNAKDGQRPDIDDDNPYVIDELPLDYSILDEIDYVYPDGNAYYSYSTRGCIRHCPFCAVPTLEPQYAEYLPLHDRINETKRLYGDRQNMLLMDNNVLASKKLPAIIDDIKSCGFVCGAKYVEPDWYNIAIRNLRLHLNDRAYIRKSFKLLSDLNNSKSLSPQEKDEVYSLREKHGLLHLETCSRKALIASYPQFSKYFDVVASSKRAVGRLRYVDFNQGVDARLFDEVKVALLEQIPVRPLRIAFDSVKTTPAYIKAVELSTVHGKRDFSNYLLYNFDDEPLDLYRRLKINVELCDRLNVSIYSFPMKYHPIRGANSHDRDFIGEKWNRKYIRAVQAVLNATKGKIGRGVSFFNKAFGANEQEFLDLLLMPETFIIFRFFFEHIGYTQSWRKAYYGLTDSERREINPIIFQNDFSNIESMSSNPRVIEVLRYYKNYRKEIADHNSELFKQKQLFERNGGR